MGRAPMPINEHVVAHNVQGVARSENPHAQAGVSQSIAKLPAHLGEKHGHHRHEHNQIIGTHQWHEFGRLPQVVEKKIEQCHGKQQQRAQQGVDHHNATQHGPNLALVARGKQSPHQWRDAIGEAQRQQNHEVKQVGHQRGSCQRWGVVVPHHDGVGIGSDNRAQLSHHDGATQAGNVEIVLTIFVPVGAHVVHAKIAIFIFFRLLSLCFKS